MYEFVKLRVPDTNENNYFCLNLSKENPYLIGYFGKGFLSFGNIENEKDLRYLLNCICTKQFQYTEFTLPKARSTQRLITTWPDEFSKFTVNGVLTNAIDDIDDTTNTLYFDGIKAVCKMIEANAGLDLDINISKK